MNLIITIISVIIAIAIIIYVIYRNKNYPCIRCEKIGCDNCEVHKKYLLLNE